MVIFSLTRGFKSFLVMAKYLDKEKVLFSIVDFFAEFDIVDFSGVGLIIRNQLLIGLGLGHQVKFLQHTSELVIYYIT